MSAHTKTIQLTSGGSVTLQVNADVSALPDAERSLVSTLLRLFHDATPRSKAGRPSVVTEEVRQRAVALLAQGCSIKTAAQILSVSRKSLWEAGITKHTKRREREAAETAARRAPTVRNLALKLRQRYLAQCRKMNVIPNAKRSEFDSIAQEMVEHYRANPGKPYVARYNGDITSDDFVRVSYEQYRPARKVEEGATA